MNASTCFIILNIFIKANVKVLQIQFKEFRAKKFCFMHEIDTLHAQIPQNGNKQVLQQVKSII